MLDTAVILAAGQGTRLKAQLPDRPKGFLCLNSRPIVEESIDRLRRVGIRRIVIVTGFGAEHYNELAARLGAGVRTVHNPEFARSGSMYSLYCARDAVSGSFLLLESDLVYEPRALEVLCKHPGSDGVLISGPTGAGDEVFVETRNGFLVGMSKQRRELGSGIAGELVGISRISPPLYAAMLAVASDAFGKSLQVSYETDCLVAAARNHRIPCPLVPDLIWGEIDDPGHLRRVRETVYPRVHMLDETAARHNMVRDLEP